MAVLFVVAYLLHYLWSRPTHWQMSREAKRKDRARRALTRGLLALIEGNWKRAEETLNYTAPDSDIPTMHYLGAARAAQHQQASERREAYLKLAMETNARAELAINLTRAELQLDGKQIVQAKQTLAKLRAQSPNHRQVLRLSCKLHVESGDWQEIVDLLPTVKQRKVFAANALNELENKAYTQLLTRMADASRLEKLWLQLPQTLRQQAALIEVYAAQMHALGHGNKALGPLGKALRTTWNPRLVRLYGMIDSDDRGNQITAAEQWLPTHGDDVELSLALGKLCFRHALWGKARYYLENSIKKEARPESYRLLAETLERIGDKEAAAVYCRKGLVLATGGALMATTAAPQS
jgi:HemY protein